MNGNHGFVRHGAAIFAVFLALASGAAAQKAETISGETKTTHVIKGERPEHSAASTAEITNLEEIPRGFWSHATLGDTVLRNDDAFFVFGAPPETPGEEDTSPSRYRHGALLDITTGPDAPENLHLFAPNTNGIHELSLTTDRLERRTDADGSATVIAEGHDVRMPYLTSRTEYKLSKDMPGLLVTTTLVNESDSEVAKEVIPSDYISWGSMRPFIPRLGWIQYGTAAEEVEFLFGALQGVWMMVAPETGTVRAVHTRGLSGMLYGDTVDMQPGESRIFRRWLLVSEQDAAQMYSYILGVRKEPKGTMVGRVIEREQAPDGSLIDKAPVPGCEIRISPLRRDGWDKEKMTAMLNKPYLVARTKANGQYDFYLPAGEYRIYPAPETRLAPRPNYASNAKPAEVTALDFGVSPPSRLIYRIQDESSGELIPGKLTIEPLRDTAQPELGFPGDVVAANTVLSSHGAGTIELAPGNYRIIASRGPEFHTTEARIEVKTSQQVDQIFKLKRAFATPGWISADIGSRTNASPASRVTPETRVVSGLAEGVEWLVTGDSGVATDLEPAVSLLGAGNRIKASPGYRSSGEDGRRLGDFLLFPASICSTGLQPDFSSVAQAKTSADVLSAMRKLCPDAAILLSRPTWPKHGYLTLQGVGMEGTGLPAGDWSADFDAFQVWEGKRQPLVNETYQTYHALLQRGARVTAFGNTNSAGTWMDEIGYPRVYIQSSTDEPAKLDPAELARNIKKGLVTVTNGPFIMLKANGEPVGSLITDTDGYVDIEIEVYAANWVTISSISINLNGRFVRRILLPSGSLDNEAGKVYPREGRPEDGRLRIAVKNDAVMDIMVEGSPEFNMDPVNPLLLPTNDPRLPKGQYAMALSAPILIDTDGNGKLDPLPEGAEPPSAMPEEEGDPNF